MEKYYTPDLSEFHVGFEFESCFWFFTQKDHEWTKATITEENLENFMELYKADAYPSAFRVKYLDREDIESLGWIHDENNCYRYENSQESYLLFYPESNRVEISDNDNSGGFYGTCLNKSELKFQMKRLGIWENK